MSEIDEALEVFERRVNLGLSSTQVMGRVLAAAYREARAEVAQLVEAQKAYNESDRMFRVQVAALHTQLYELRTPLKDWDKKLAEKNDALAKRNAEIAALQQTIKRMWDPYGLLDRWQCDTALSIPAEPPKEGT